MTVCRVTCKWSNNQFAYTNSTIDATTEFSIGVPDDPCDHWLVECRTRHAGKWEVWYIHLGAGSPNPQGYRLSELTDNPDTRLLRFYAGSFEMYPMQKNPIDLGRLAVQIERSSASIEGRAPRRFMGLSVR